MAGRKVVNMGRTCHGTGGREQISIAPHIGGEPKEYLESLLKAYRVGKRRHEIMSEFASELSDQKIRELANWLANLKLEIKSPE